jgi:ketosteroid isomerase-like protein
MERRTAAVSVRTTTHPHFQLARRLWDAIARADVEALGEVLDRATVWRVMGHSPLAGTYVGADAILDFLARVGEATDELRSSLTDIFVGERGGVIQYRVQASRGAQSLDTVQIFVFEVERDRIASATLTPTDQLAYDRFFQVH